MLLKHQWQINLTRLTQWVREKESRIHWKYHFLPFSIGKKMTLLFIESYNGKPFPPTWLPSFILFTHIVYTLSSAKLSVWLILSSLLAFTLSLSLFLSRSFFLYSLSLSHFLFCPLPLQVVLCSFYLTVFLLCFLFFLILSFFLPFFPFTLEELIFPSVSCVCMYACVCKTHAVFRKKEKKQIVTTGGYLWCICLKFK